MCAYCPGIAGKAVISDEKPSAETPNFIGVSLLGFACPGREIRLLTERPFILAAISTSDARTDPASARTGLVSAGMRCRRPVVCKR